MDDHKFCFIICTNNNLLLNECIHYINHLTVPDGYSIDLLTITDAPSMTAGYSEGMAASDAKYKIYMHQDVFILNKNILVDLLNIFESDPLIGMIGIIGYETISPDGIMWTQTRVGNLYRRKAKTPYSPLSEYTYSLNDDGFKQAAVIDGFFMATAKDFPWDTEHLKDWDFYDAFHSINFLQNGYKIVVPTPKNPWCMHDDNLILKLDNYNYYRHIFMDLYSNYLGKKFNEI